MRYNNIGFGMEFPLPRVNSLYKGYVVICQCELANSKESNRDYKVEFWLTCEGVEMIMKTNLEPVTFNDMDARELKLEVCRTVDDLFSQGAFEYSVKDYEYMLNCFDEGNNVLNEVGIDD